MATLRYDVKKNEHNSYWTVVDVRTGEPVVIHGVLVGCLTAEEADYMVDLLNRHELIRKGARALH